MRAQGALEYLIIIAAVLGIAAVVVLFVGGAFIGSSGGADISKCRLAASNCAKDMAMGISTTCNYCDSACASATTNPCSQPEAAKGVSKGAIGCCKQGKTSQIYPGSIGCGTSVHIAVGTNRFYAPADWEATKASTLCSIYLIYRVKYLDSLGSWHTFAPGISSPAQDFDICPGVDMIIIILTTTPEFDMIG